MEKGDAEFQGTILKHLENLIEVRNNAINIVMEKKEQERMGTEIVDPSGEDKKLMQLRNNLNYLLFNYWPKRNYQQNFSVESELEEKIEEGNLEPNADNLDFKECRKVLYKLNELMEKLGHTKVETEKIGRTKV